jgi:serine phosphatase RsbU (regulator of sigma subunit)
MHHLLAWPGYEIRPALYLYTEPVDLQIEDILKGKGIFQRSSDLIPNMGVIHHPVWVRFTVGKGLPSRLYLTIELPSIDQIDLYTEQNGFLHHKKTGRIVPATLREMQDRHHTFLLPYTPDRENVYYLKVASDLGINLPLYVRDETAYDRALQRDTFIQAFYYGWITVMISYNLFLFLTMGEKGHLLYAITLFFSNLLFQLSLNGFLALYLFPSMPAVSRELHNYIYIFALLSSVVLATYLLATRRHIPRLHRFLQFGIFLTVAILVFSFFLPFRIVNQLLDYTAAMMLLLFLFSGFICARTGYRPAVYFFVGFGAVVVGALLSLFQFMGYLPVNAVTKHAFQFTQLMEVVLVGFSVADRYNHLKADAEEARRRASKQEERMHAIRQELNLAGRIQGRLLQASLPENAVVRHLPSAVIGGDLYYGHRSDCGHLTLLLADVAGHGLPAALEASMLFIAFREVRNDSPAQILKGIHEILSPVLPDLFITALIVEIQDKRMICSSAGHPHCLILNRDQNLVVRPPLRGKPLGVGDRWSETMVDLKPTDRILLYTDGLIETVTGDSGEEFGLDRLRAELLKTASMDLESAADRLLNTLLLHAKGKPEDDVTFMLIDP